MSDLIDRDSALKAIEGIRCFFDKSLEPYQSRAETIEVIKNLPTVDRPQGFLRCKDCKWWGRHVEFKDGSTMIDCKKGKSMDPDGYCHYGEREVEE